MTTTDIINQIAAEEGLSPADIRREMAATIDAAWSSPDPAARAFQQQLFPAGKPTVELFLATLAGKIRP